MSRNINAEGRVPPDGGRPSHIGRATAHMARVTRPLLDGPVANPTQNQARHIEALEAVHTAIGDLSKGLASMVPKVLSSEVIALDVNGQAFRQYRVPFRSIAVTSESSQPLTLTDSPLNANAPGPGVGAARIPARCFVVANLAGYVLSIYGGVPGDLVTVSTYAQPQPPNVSKLLAATGATFQAYGITGAAPPAGTVVCSVALPAGVWAAQTATLLDATLTAADLDNYQLFLGTANLGVLITNTTTQGSAQNPWRPPQQVTVPAGGATLAIQVGPGNGSAAAVYRASLLVTPGG